MTEVQDLIEQLYSKYYNDLSGKVNTSIPELSSCDPDAFAISITTIDGRTFSQGTDSEKFTIQSISKAFTYAMALEKHGAKFVEEKVGMEPTGEDFDSIIKIDDQGRPYNPMVNSGAMVVTSLLNSIKNKTPEKNILQFFEQFTEGELAINHDVAKSELENSHKNWAIAHLLRHFKCLPKGFQKALELYTKQCAIELNVKQLSLMGATLANGAVNPLTQRRCLALDNLKYVLSMILTCGMYNYSGEWAYDVGVPAKSGISGSILMVVPGKMGIAVYSPRLDKRGNSVRGIKLCEELSQRLGLHVFHRSMD